MPRSAYTGKTIALPVPQISGIPPEVQSVLPLLQNLTSGVQNGFSRYVAQTNNPIPFIYIGPNAISPLTVPKGLVAIYVSATPASNDFIVNLPPASGSGALVGVQKAGVSTHNVIVVPNGADMINGRTINPTLFQTNQAIILIDLETGKWGIFGSYVPPGPLFAQTATVTIANSATETTILGAGGGSLTLPANFLDIGAAIEIEAWGFFSAAPGATFRFRFYLGSAGILDTAASILSYSQTSGVWHLNLSLTCQTKGSSGTVAAQGSITYGLPFSMIGGGFQAFLPQLMPATIDTTAAQTINLTFQWGAASALSTLTTTNATMDY